MSDTRDKDMTCDYEDYGECRVCDELCLVYKEKAWLKVYGQMRKGLGRPGTVVTPAVTHGDSSIMTWSCFTASGTNAPFKVNGKMMSL